MQKPRSLFQQKRRKTFLSGRCVARRRRRKSFFGFNGNSGASGLSKEIDITLFGFPEKNPNFLCLAVDEDNEDFGGFDEGGDETWRDVLPPAAVRLEFLFFRRMLVTEGKNGTTAGNILQGNSALPKVNGTNKKSMASSVLRKNLKELPPQLTRFQVTLENPNRIFYAGDELKGNVEVDLSENLPIQGIILKIVGEAYVNVSDEPRPWTTKRVSNIKSTFKSSKISPSSISERIDLTGNDFRVPFYVDPTTKWETATMTTVTGSRSQRSTLQRDQNPAVITKKSSIRRQEESNRRFRSHEKYFEHKAYVFGHKYSSTREMMWTGKHSFPFTYTLPSKLPASFHGRYGYVRYFCEASLERHNLPTIQRRTFFSVNTIMDLNTDSKADSGVSKGKKTNSWCFCCASGTVIVSTKVKRRGFVPGETIPVQAHILNVSDKTISKISAKIIQIATYYSSKAFRNHPDEAIVSERVKGAIPPGESSAWDDEGPKVPPVPPSSTMIDCKLITLDYRLDFVLDIIGAKESLVIRMPLRIGSVPLEKTFNNFFESPDENSFWSPLQTLLPQNIQTKYSNIPVPYSMKCVKGDRNVNRYYFRQIPRNMHVAGGINLRMPNAPPQPVITDDTEVYAPRYLTYREIDLKRQVGKTSEKHTKEKTTLRTTLNGGMLTESNLQRHLVICVSPQASTRRITPSSATNLIDATPDSSSVWNSPISVKSIRSITSKKSLPAMKLDLINFISDSNSIRCEKYKQTIQEFLDHEKRFCSITVGRLNLSQQLEACYSFFRETSRHDEFEESERNRKLNEEQFFKSCSNSELLHKLFKPRNSNLTELI